MTKDADEPDQFLLEAMREVDAMLPGSPPIAPPVRESFAMALIAKEVNRAILRGGTDSHGPS